MQNGFHVHSNESVIYKNFHDIKINENEVHDFSQNNSFNAEITNYNTELTQPSIGGYLNS